MRGIPAWRGGKERGERGGRGETDEGADARKGADVVRRKELGEERSE